MTLWRSIYDVPPWGGGFISSLFSKLFTVYLFIFMCNGAEPSALVEAVSQTPSPRSKTTSTRRWRLNALLTLCLPNVTKLSAAGLENGARQLNKKTCCSISSFEYLRVAAFIWKANIYSSQLQCRSLKPCRRTRSHTDPHVCADGAGERSPRGRRVKMGPFKLGQDLSDPLTTTVRSSLSARRNDIHHT